ncbi:hypothetical protein PIB30_011840 [Stylosanthes scabra]|uniref:Transposase (putative) gypsy type domain-containing protein n=1 Tax=Stylosanthes scabra TaxID=79078 RepID=A0ABU6T5Q1_9FABA|nr:hypothetical protein [Stylosanthes scabra]
MAMNRETDENGKAVVVVGENYSWVKGEVRELSSLFLDMESVEKIGDPSIWVREGSGVKLRFLPCEEGDRVYFRGEGWEYVYIYTTVFLDVGIKFPFTEFECGVLSQLKCAPSQIHPNAWAFIRGFEILMEYLGVDPLLEVFFSFFQAKGVRKGGLVTLNNVQGKTLFELYRQSYKDFKEMFVKVACAEELFPFYLDEFDLERFPLYWYSEPNFFKSRAERGHSASNVIKTEEEVVVNQPPEKKRVRLRKLHGYGGEEDLTSVWSEHFPVSVIAEEHFQSKTDLELVGSVDDITRAQFMQVCAARLLCIGRYEDLKAKKEAEQKKEKNMEVQKSLEMERKFQAAMEQITAKDRELSELKSSVEQLKGKLQKLDKEKTELEARVVELCVKKKEAETSKEDHGFVMMEAGFERARKQAEFFFPDLKFDKLDPIKVVHNGALVDDDEVDLEGGDDHNPDDRGA